MTSSLTKSALPAAFVLVALAVVSLNTGALSRAQHGWFLGTSAPVTGTHKARLPAEGSKDCSSELERLHAEVAKLRKENIELHARLGMGVADVGLGGPAAGGRRRRPREDKTTTTTSPPPHPPTPSPSTVWPPPPAAGGIVTAATATVPPPPEVQQQVRKPASLRCDATHAETRLLLEREKRQLVVKAGAGSLLGRNLQPNASTVLGAWVVEQRGFAAEERCEVLSSHAIYDDPPCLREDTLNSSIRPLRFAPLAPGLCPFDGAAFLRAIHGRRFGFVGDSLSRQMVNALLCALSRQGHSGHTDKGKLKISDLTVTFNGSYGGASVSYYSNSFGSMDKLVEHLGKLDIAVVNLGRHFNKHSKGGRNEGAYAPRLSQHMKVLRQFAQPPTDKTALCRLGLALETLPSHFPDAAGSGEWESWRDSPAPLPSAAAAAAPISCAARHAGHKSGGVDEHTVDWRNGYLHSTLASLRAAPQLVAVEELMSPRWDAHFQNYRPKLDCVHWCNRPSVWAPVLMELQRALLAAIDAQPERCR